MKTIEAAIEEGKCHGCGEVVPSFNNPCWDCVKARHRAALTHKCSCGKKRRERICSTGSRKWIACDRCLGSYKQLS